MVPLRVPAARGAAGRQRGRGERPAVRPGADTSRGLAALDRSLSWHDDTEELPGHWAAAGRAGVLPRSGLVRSALCQPNARRCSRARKGGVVHEICQALFSRGCVRCTPPRLPVCGACRHRAAVSAIAGRHADRSGECGQSSGCSCGRGGTASADKASSSTSSCSSPSTCCNSAGTVCAVCGRGAAAAATSTAAQPAKAGAASSAAKRDRHG